MPVDDAADAVILRWPKAQQVAPQPKGRTIRQRLGWLAFPIWLVRRDNSLMKKAAAGPDGPAVTMFRFTPLPTEAARAVRQAVEEA